jgi:hypothetical protein
VAYLPADDRVEPWEPNVTALLDPAKLKWKDLVDGRHADADAWPKEEFETYSRDVQKRRREIRAADRPESEMDALFLEDSSTTAAARRQPNAARVGAFEGANYEARGYFRPQVDCIMFTRNVMGGFCAVCRRLSRPFSIYL